MEDLKKFLTGKVLLSESDTLPETAEKVLQQVRREKTDNAVIFISSGTSSIIAGSEKTWSAVKSYIEDNESITELVRVGCTGPSNFEPLLCIQLPGKNKLFFRNITEEKVESLLNGVFHNDINKDDLAGQHGSRGFELWPGIPFIDELDFFAHQKRVVLSNSQRDGGAVNFSITLTFDETLFDLKEMVFPTQPVDEPQTMETE